MEKADKRLLVIDDDKTVLESCKRIFSEDGYEVIATENPRHGLELAQEGSFSVILCDLKMPELNGVDVVEILDKRSPDTAIIMITGYPEVESATEALKRGAIDYVQKPFEPDAILASVNRALAKKRQMRESSLKAAAGMVRDINFPVPNMEDKSPKTIAETVSQKVGVGKVTSPWIQVLLLGILAGAYIGFGGMLASTVTFDMSGHFGVGFTKFMSGSVFSLGLILVIVAGAELFTGNNLMISSVMAGEITFGKMLKRWGLVYAANFIGAIIVSLLFVASGLWKVSDNALGAAAVKVAYGKVSIGFWAVLVRGIGCNWLVCLAVWMALAAKQTIGKISAIFFPIMGFVALGFEHSVANMYFIPTGIFLRTLGGITAPAGAVVESLNWGSFVAKNLIPVTIGNIIGGVVFVGMSYWSAYLRPAKLKGN